MTTKAESKQDRLVEIYTEMGYSRDEAIDKIAEAEEAAITEAGQVGIVHSLEWHAIEMEKQYRGLT